MSGLRRVVFGILKLQWLLLRDCGLILVSLAKWDLQSAGERVRMVTETLHEDLVKGIVGLQRLLRFRRRIPETVDRILIVKLDRIGDMVNTTPVFDVLRERYPGARLDIVGHPVPLSLLEHDERIAERIPYCSWLYHALPILPAGPRTWWLLLKLVFRRYPLVVYLRGSFPFLALACTSRFAAAKFVEGEPVVTRYLNALEPVLGPVPRQLKPTLRFRRDDIPVVRRELGVDAERGQPLVVIHATASSEAKSWPRDRFARLADEFVREYDACVGFLGGPGDGAALHGIAEMAQESHRYHCTFALSGVVAAISEADLFVGNDSGLSHIAAAVDTPSVIVWGPANLSMARPVVSVPDLCQVLYTDLPCRAHCPETRCNSGNQYECLTSIHLEDVLKAAARILPCRSASVGSRRPQPDAVRSEALSR